MSKHLKIFVSALFMVIIILAVCITRFYFDVSKNTGNNTSTADIYSKSEQKVNGMCIFESENSLFGVIDEDNNIILESQWQSVEIENNGFFIVSDVFRDDTLYGCLDSEGNTIVPFIYSGFEKFGTEDMLFYIGKISDSDSCIVYDSDFNPCLGRVWDSFEIDGNKIKLYYNDNVYSYFADSDGISLKSVIIKNKAMNRRYSISSSSRIILSKLDYVSLEKISDCISAYLNYSFTGNCSFMDDYVSSEKFQECREFFSDYPEVTSKKLREVKDVSIYQEKLEDGSQYITASVKIRAAVSCETDEGSVDLTDNYRAVIRFEEKEFGTVNMISASFSDDEIEYDD